MPQPTRKYLFLHRSQAGSAPMPNQKPSPEQMQAMLAKWNAWKEKFKDNIVDWGDKLKPGGKVVSGSTVSDGPFVEAKEIIGGFMIVAAESYEQAVVIAQEMPSGPGALIEIREMAGAQMIIPFAAFAGLDVEFERHCSEHCGAHRLDRFVRNERPPKIGMQYCPGQVEDGAQR